VLVLVEPSAPVGVELLFAVELGLVWSVDVVEIPDGLVELELDWLEDVDPSVPDEELVEP
jgi:hypothetical protein